MSWLPGSEGGASAASSWLHMDSSSPSRRSSLANSVQGSGDSAAQNDFREDLARNSSQSCASYAVSLCSDTVEGHRNEYLGVFPQHHAISCTNSGSLPRASPCCITTGKAKQLSDHSSLTFMFKPALQPQTADECGLTGMERGPPRSDCSRKSRQLLMYPRSLM